MDLDRYLQRIAHRGPLAVDAATLEALRRAHLYAVPFENLSIGWGEPIVVDVVRHYDKIVERRRAYRVDRGDADGVATWTLWNRDPHGRWEESNRFADLARPMDPCARMCRFHQTSPESPFTQKRLCSLAVPDGRITLSGDEWIVTDLDGTRTATPIEDEVEAARLL